MLRIRSFEAQGYRSLRRVSGPAGDLTVFVGANGSGKTNLYRVLQLLHASATGRFAREIAGEGGMESVLWAGRRDPGQPVRIVLAVELEAPGSPGRYRYSIEAGVPFPTAAALPLEPQVKEERLDFLHRGRRRPLLSRRGPLLVAWDGEGGERQIAADLLPSETGLAALEAASAFPDQHLVRRTLADWRFYHDLRTDTASSMRRPALAVTTPTLAGDGGDLAAVFATLAHVRQDMTDVQAAVADAFLGASLDVPLPKGTASFGLTSSDFKSDGGRPRIFSPAELSDGTLRYLALVGALLAYRLPAFLALNEPEASLHPDLIAPLGRLILRAAEQTQIWVVTHSEPLADMLAASGAIARRVVKRAGATDLEAVDGG